MLAISVSSVSKYKEFAAVAIPSFSIVDSGVPTNLSVPVFSRTPVREAADKVGCVLISNTIANVNTMMHTNVNKIDIYCSFINKCLKLVSLFPFGAVKCNYSKYFRV